MSFALRPTNGSRQTVHVSKPPAGESVSISCESGAKIALGFEPVAATVSRAGNDLVLEFADGGKVTMNEFFAVDDQPLPSLVLPDGNEVDFAGFLADFNIKFETAAGPVTGPNAPGSGEGQYADNPGSLIDGIDRLGSLGTYYWGRATEVSDFYQGQGAPFSAAMTTGPSSPEIPQYSITVQGEHLVIDESYMEGGTKYTGGAIPVYDMSFLVTTNDGFASVTIDNVTYSVADGTLQNFSEVRGSNGFLSDPVVTANPDGTFTLSFTYQQGSAHSHSGPGRDTAYAVDTFAITVTAANGDSASLVANVDIVDDVPQVNLYCIDDGGFSLITLDAETIGGDFSTAETSFTAAFETAAVYGLDGPGSTVVSGYTLSVTDAASGFTSNGKEVVLSMDGSAVVGKVGDLVVFTLHVDADGKVTLAQYEAIDHPDGTEPNESLFLDSNKISLSAMVAVTDGDGDSASDTVSIDLGGKIGFTDDGPVATSDNLTLLATEISVVGSVLTGEFESNSARTDSSGAPDNFGGDGESAGVDKCVFDTVITFTTPEGISFLLNVGSDGELSYNNQEYGSLKLATDGSGVYTYTRPEKTSINGTISVEYTIHDRDGDSSTSTLTIEVEKLRPCAEIKAVGEALLVHEDGLSWGTQAGGADHPVSTSGYVEIESVNGIESISFSVGASTYVITLPAGWDGSAYFPPPATGSFTADLGAMVIDQIVFNATTGKYEAHFTYTLKENTLAHSDAGDGSLGEHHDLLSTGDTAAKAAMPEIGVVVTDTAGHSSDSSTITIDIHDDGPELSLTHATPGYQNDQEWVDDSFVHLDNSYMTTGTLEPNYGADRAFGDGDDYLTVSFTGTRSVMVNGTPVSSPVESDEPIVVQFDGNGKATVYTGLGTIEFTRSDGVISYRYLATHGLQKDSEEITFTVVDGDEDKASRSVSVIMDHDVPAGTSYVDEAGLASRGPDGYDGLGSFHAGYEAASQTFTVFLPEGTTGFAWDLDAINGDLGNAIKADANGDGEYTPVTWSVDANGDLIATAEGETILRVSPPESDGNGLVLLQDSESNWYGTMEVTLEYPIQHPPGDGYNVLGLYLGFNATSPGEGDVEQVTSNAVSVAIIDDAPNAREMTLEVVEAVKAPEDVYLIMDVSNSLRPESLVKGMEALRELVQKYVSEGIEATFSLVTFGDEAKEWGTHLTAAEMLTVLDAGLSGDSSDIAAYWRQDVGANTNYDSALDLVQHLITAAQQDGSLRYYNQKVYFISDGLPNVGIDESFGSWKSFIQEHGADAGNERVEVYAVGVGNALSSDASWDYLMQVTGDGSDHGIKVNYYSDLADTLTALIAPGKTTGNLLGVDIDNNDIRSADLSTVVSIEVGGATYEVQADGATVEITIDTGVTLTVYANGNYTITSSKSVDSDQTYNLKYTIKDADGDTSTADLQLVLKDAKPEAFDNVAGEAVTYIKGTAVILDDFDTNNGWLSANSNTAYGQTLTGTYTTIDGNSAILTDDVSFVKILPNFDSTSRASFDKALSYVTGKNCAETFEDTTDSPRYGSYIEKSFDLLAEGTVKFNYIFTHGTGSNVSIQEKAFWVLLDENGEVCGSGLITSTSQTSSCVISIPVKYAGQYTLVLGCYDTYTGNNTMPTLYVDQVVFVPADSSNIYNGNVIEDKSPLGVADNLADHATLYKVRFTDMNDKDREYTVGAGVFALGLLVLEDVFAKGDKLTINDNGNYAYQTVPDSSFDTVNIEYAIKEPGSDDSDWATLYIRSDEYRFEGADDAAQHTDGNDVIIGTDGGVTLDGGDGNDVIYGGDGDDVIYGGDGNDTLYGGDGDDLIYGGDGDDVIYGGDGNDTLYGGDGDDIIYGGDGNDILYGGTGNDTLYGGSGSDIFAWNAQDFDGGRDVIMDFTLREDRLSFADIFGVGEQNIISIKTILDALNQGRVDISATSETLLTVFLDDGFNTQNVEIHLSGSSLSSELMTAISADDDAAKAALLQQMLTSITC